MVKITFDSPIGAQEFKKVALKQNLSGDDIIKLYDDIKLKEEIAKDKNTNWDTKPFAKDLFEPPIDPFFQDLLEFYHGKTYLNNLNNTKQNAQKTKQQQKQTDLLNKQVQKNNLEQALINFRDS
tara:strand:- start:22 stop:393 length:372 start_codon:yes stop_codon:yes gene_type:complete